MKLRNKKTGEIVESWAFVSAKYNSLAELCEEWEDSEPAEPLIKDEKIRKAVRTWAEVNGIKDVKHYRNTNEFNRYGYIIMFDYDFDEHDGLEDEKNYTIAELCGEEEE